MKAQVAVEFMLIFGVFLLGIVFTIIASWNNMANAEKSTIDFEVNRILGLVANRINTAYLEGDGFSIGLNIPEKIGLYDYTLQIEGNILWLSVNEFSQSKKLLTTNITGSLAKGDNMVKNVDGGVEIA